MLKLNLGQEKSTILKLWVVDMDKYVKIEMENIKEVVKDLGFDQKGKVQQYVTHRAKVRMDRHVPSDTTALRNQAIENYDEVIYGAPGTSSNVYASIVYRNPALNFQGAPQRGAHWDRKTIADQGDQFFNEIQEFSDKQKDI